MFAVLIRAHPRESAVWFFWKNFDYAAVMDSTGAIVSEMHQTLLKAFMRTYQQRYFRSTREVIDLVIAPLDGTACFKPGENTIQIHPALTPFSKLAKIAILHELIHSKLHKQGEPDEAEGQRFQAEVKKLLEAGAYKGLL